jgi:uncharacterized phage protein (TIGR02218 family)
MTFAGRDTSIEDGQPVELYEFNRGNTSWFFCNSSDDVEVNSDIYYATQMSRSSFTQSGEFDRSSVTVTMQRDHPFVGELIQSGAMGKQISLTIKKLHWTDVDLERVVFWKGRVLSWKSNGAAVALNCESVFTSLRRTGLRAKYQRSCRHALYSSGCGVGQGSVSVSSTVSGASGPTLTMSSLGAYPDGYFSGGLARDADGVSRFIASHAGGVIILTMPFPTEVGGQTLELLPGCDRTRETCHVKFNNVLNFGGFPYIPGTNPFSGVSLV